MVWQYYSDGSVTISHGNCREDMPSLSLVDAIVTDPPFLMSAAHFQSRVKRQRSWESCRSSARSGRQCST